MGTGTKRGDVDEMGDDGGGSQAWMKVTMELRGQNMGGSEAGIWGGAQRPEYGGSEAKIRGLRGQNKGAQRPE
jgi:hypothetical protein